MSSSDESSQRADTPAFKPVELMAADWVLRRQKGLNGKEERAFRVWLEVPENHAVYLETAEASHLLDSLRFGAPEGTILFEAPLIPPAAGKHGLRGGLFAAAAIAVIAITFFAWPRSPQPLGDRYTTTLTTEVGGLSNATLPDGSVVHLNTDSAVRVTYLPKERRLTLLHGEAYFTVAKNPDRPFWVTAGPVAVRAVGTEFNIRLQANAVDVLVTEGKVRVVDGDGRAAARDKPVDELGPLLASGQLGAVPFGSPSGQLAEAMIVKNVEPQLSKRVLAWQTGRLEFSDQPLSEVVAEFNRYNPHKIVIADPKLSTRRFGGSFASHEIAPLVELLEQSFGVLTEEHDGETVLRSAK